MCFGKSQKKTEERTNTTTEKRETFCRIFKTAQNLGSASASRSELVSESVSVEVSFAESDSHSSLKRKKDRTVFDFCCVR
jgi:hypothetical protein